MRRPTRSAPQTSIDGFQDFEHQTRAVLDRAAIGTGALVGAVAQEFVEQIAVGAVDFHAVEAGGLGILRRLS